jgi:hypothetical protein
MVPVAGLLTAFWVVPFWWRRDYVNDMGWERLPIPNGEQTSVAYYLLPDGLRYVMVFAASGCSSRSSAGGAWAWCSRWPGPGSRWRSR